MPPPLGSPFTTKMTYTITGTFSPGLGGIDVLPTTGGASPILNSPQFLFGSPTFMFTVNNGMPFLYSLTLFATVNGPNGVPPGFPNPNFFHTQGSASYNNTMVLSGLSFQDSNGVPITAEMRSSNGQLFAAAAVPEPSSLILACLSALGLAGYRWRLRGRVAGRLG